MKPINPFAEGVVLQAIHIRKLIRPVADHVNHNSI